MARARTVTLVFRLQPSLLLAFATTTPYDKVQIVEVMAQAQINAKKQQGIGHDSVVLIQAYLTDYPMMPKLDLQQQYTTYKNSLQQLAQRIGDVEQETEEHKCVSSPCFEAPTVGHSASKFFLIIRFTTS